MSSRWMFAVLALLFVRLPPSVGVQLVQEEHSNAGGLAVTGEERDVSIEPPTGHTTQPDGDSTSDLPPIVYTADHIWPNKTIYFAFGQTLDSSTRGMIVQAMDEWSAHTCLQFQFASSSDQDHLVFVRLDYAGCSSYVGRVGGAQIVYMATDCLSKGHAMHLIGLAIGLFHESSRPDRDNYISIVYKNVLEREMAEFEKLDDDKFHRVPDVGYDIESIMHLGPFAHSKNGKRTVRQRQSAPLSYKNCPNLLEMGQREQLSYLDKLRVNKLYSCTEHVLALEGVGRECVINPTSEAPPTSTELTTETSKCPLPSPPISPLPNPFRRLKSGSAITLQLRNAEAGVRCSPRCRAKRCQGNQASCHGPAYQFDIIAVDENATKITSGSKVALRSRCNTEKWLDCTGIRNTCFISRCLRCTGDRCGNHDDHTSSCDHHHFTILAVGRREGRLINSNYPIQLVREGLVLTCSDAQCYLSNGDVAEEKEGEENSYSLTILF